MSIIKAVTVGESDNGRSTFINLFHTLDANATYSSWKKKGTKENITPSQNFAIFNDYQSSSSSSDENQKVARRYDFDVKKSLILCFIDYVGIGLEHIYSHVRPRDHQNAFIVVLDFKDQQLGEKFANYSQWFASNLPAQLVPHVVYVFINCVGQRESIASVVFSAIRCQANTHFFFHEMIPEESNRDEMSRIWNMNKAEMKRCVDYLESLPILLVSQIKDVNQFHRTISFFPDISVKQELSALSVRNRILRKRMWVYWAIGFGFVLWIINLVLRFSNLVRYN